MPEAWRARRTNTMTLQVMQRYRQHHPAARVAREQEQVRGGAPEAEGGSGTHATTPEERAAAAEEERKSPSRGTELCAVVESMFSFNEMFSILGSVADADRAERIALNALPATWASPRPAEMWSHQYFQSVNQFRAVNVSDGHHLYQDPFPAHESFFSASDHERLRLRGCG